MTVALVEHRSSQACGDRTNALAASCDARNEKPIDPVRFAGQVEAAAAAGHRQ